MMAATITGIEITWVIASSQTRAASSSITPTSSHDISPTFRSQSGTLKTLLSWPGSSSRYCVSGWPASAGPRLCAVASEPSPDHRAGAYPAAPTPEPPSSWICRPDLVVCAGARLGEERESRRSAILFAIGSLCFLVGPFPGYAAARRIGRRRDDVLRRLDLLHVGGPAPVPHHRRHRRRQARLVGGGNPVRRHALLQRQHATPRSRIHSTRMRSTAWSGAPTSTARSASSSPATWPTSPRAVPTAGAGGTRRSGGWRSSTCSAASRSGSRRSPATSIPSTGDVLALGAANFSTALGALCFLIGAIMLLPKASDARGGRGLAQ